MESYVSSAKIGFSIENSAQTFEVRIICSSSTSHFYTTKRIKIKWNEFSFSRPMTLHPSIYLTSKQYSDKFFLISFSMNFTYFCTKIVDRLQVRYHENLWRKSIAQMITEWLLCKVEFVNVTSVHYTTDSGDVSLSWVLFLFFGRISSNSTKYDFHQNKNKNQRILLCNFIPTIIYYLQNSPFFLSRMNPTQRIVCSVMKWAMQCSSLNRVVHHVPEPHCESANDGPSITSVLRSGKSNRLNVNEKQINWFRRIFAVAYFVVLFIACDHQSVSHFGTNHHQFACQWIICIQSRRRRHRLCFVWNILCHSIDWCATRNHAKDVFKIDFIFDSLLYSKRNKNHTTKKCFDSSCFMSSTWQLPKSDVVNSTNTVHSPMVSLKLILFMWIFMNWKFREKKRWRQDSNNTNLSPWDSSQTIYLRLRNGGKFN